MTRPTVSCGWRRAIAVGALAPAVLLGASAAGVGASSTVCESETYLWSGTASLGGQIEVVPTGVNIPAIAGTDLIAVGASADGVSADGVARALTVTVGGRVVASGAMLDGGEISLQYSGDTTVDVTGAAVVVNRCHTVASAATATATRLPTDDPAPVVGPTSPSLPVTGGALVPLLVAAAGVLAAGVAASGVARRRLTPIPIPVRVRAGLRRPQR